MKNLISLLLFATIFMQGYSQLIDFNQKDIQEIKNRKLIVINETPKQKYIDYLKKKDEMYLLSSYDSLLNDYNEKLQIAISAYWPYQKDFELKSHEEVVEMSKAKNKDYIVVSTSSAHSNFTEEKLWVMTQNLNFDYAEIENHFSNLKDLRGSYDRGSFLTITLIEDYKVSGKEILTARMPRFLPSDADFSFTVNYLSWLIDYYSMAPFYAKMEDKTDTAFKNLKYDILYIKEEDLNDKVSQNEIDNLFPFEFKLLKKSEFDSLYLKQPAKSAFLFCTGVSKYSYFTIIESQTGELMYNKHIFPLVKEISSINREIFNDIKDKIEALN